MLTPQPAAAACYAGLSALLQPCHGSVPVLASMVLRLVTPALLAVGKPEVGDDGGSCKVTSATPAKEAVAASTMARDFVAKLLRWVVFLPNLCMNQNHHPIASAWHAQSLSDHHADLGLDVLGTGNAQPRMMPSLHWPAATWS